VTTHVIVEQYDPAEPIAGGIPGVISDMIRLSPPGNEFRVIGVDAAGHRRLGRWTEADVGGRTIDFLPVARFSAADARRVPHGIRLAAGKIRYQPVRLGASFVHAHRVEIGLTLRGGHPRTPLVQFVHTDSREAARHRVESFWRFLPAVHDLVERRVVGAAHRAWIFSGAAFERLQGLPAARRGKNWFDEELFRVGVGRRAGLTIAWIGRFEASKDPLAAVAALAELRRAGLSFDAWFAGAGSLRSDLEALVEREGLSEQVELLGAVSPSVIADRLRATSALLVTSRWEGQPRAVLEALGSGVGVVAVGVGDIPLLVRHGRTGFVAETTAPGELSGLLARVGELDTPAEIAESVRGHHARIVIGEMFAALRGDPS